MTSSLPPEPEPADRPTGGAGSPADPTEPTSDPTDPGTVWASIWSEAMRAAFGTPPAPDPDDER